MAWQPAGSGSAQPSTFGAVLPSLTGPGAAAPPPRPAPTVALAPAGPPGETGTPPRTAFAVERPAPATSPRIQRWGKASVLGVCVFEAAVVVPTLHVEVYYSKDTEESWSVFLRILIAIVRLYPIVVPFIPSSSCIAAVCGVRWRQGPICQGLGTCLCVVFSVMVCPEVRWMVAITLDMWYLLTTQLNLGLAEVSCVILLVANIILCFVDTLTLIMMLAVKSSEDLDPAPEMDNVARPRPVKLGQSDDGTNDFDPTCVICLSDFKPDEDVLQLPCNHTFHSECITKWLSRSRHCPLRCPPVVFPPRISRTQSEAASSSDP